DILDRLGDHTAVGVAASDLAVLKRRLDEVEDVVDDDVAPGVAQIADMLREGSGAAVGGGEEQLRARGEIGDDLEHRGSLVARARREYGHRAEIAAGLARGEVGDAVRQYA